MTMRWPVSALVGVAVLCVAAAASGEDRKGAETSSTTKSPSDPAPAKDEPTAKKESEKPKPKGPQMATFGGGCFWCTEAVFEQVPGVLSVVSGYAGGTVPFPTYGMVSSGMTGHAEVVNIVFDPTVVSYEKLLELFWKTHDPSTPNAQGPDVGPQYRSIILYRNEEQKLAAEKVYRQLKAKRVLRGPVVTQLVPMTGFFPAEPYHQDYYQNHPFDPYSIVYIAPKFDKLPYPGTAKKKKPRGTTKSAHPASGVPKASPAVPKRD